MQMLKKFSWALLVVLVAVPLVYASAYSPLKKGNTHSGNRWLLNKSVVTAVDVANHTITATKAGTTYSIDFANARIVRKYNAAADISEVLVGDRLQVFGTISGTNVTAAKVKDLSIQRANGKFNGTIKSINTTEHTFVLQTKKRGDQAVTASPTTVIRYKSQTKTFDDLAVGNRVIVTGIWNSTHKTVYGLTRIRITKL